MGMNKKLLIVDDEEAIVFALGEYFSAAGYDVDTASDLEQATALLKRKRYHVLLADLRLGGFGGSEGLALIADVRDRAPQTHSILLTAYGTPEVRAQAQALGVAAVVHKPVPLAQLASMMHALTSRNHSCNGIS